jgi:hypothetical protein
MSASTAPDQRLLREMNKSVLNVSFCISSFGISCIAPLLPNVCLHKPRKRILVTAITFCKRTDLSLARAWTDIIVGSGCTSDLYATTARCQHTATLLYSGNSEKVYLLNPKDITPLETS